MDQKTIQKPITLEGIGVHSGQPSAVTLMPSQPNTGITLQHKQHPEDIIHVGTVIPESAMHATVLKARTWAISTTEHLMAALYGLGIDNVAMVIDGYEIPIYDGSALPFVHAIEDAGIKVQGLPKRFITPKQALVFEEEHRSIRIEPVVEPVLYIDYAVAFDHPLVKKHNFTGRLDANPDFFKHDIAPARTFGFINQLPFLRKHGLAQGTNLGNTVVVGEEEILNNCRFEDEFIRHKVLDLIGDLALLGTNLAGSIKARKTGHSFNRKVVEHFIQNPDMWQTL